MILTDGNICGVLTSMNFFYLMHHGRLPIHDDFSNNDALSLRRFMQFCIMTVSQNSHYFSQYSAQRIDLDPSDN